MKILITPSSFGECGSEPLELLENADLDVQLNPRKRRLTSDEVIALGSDCVGILAGLECLDDATLEQFSNLLVISRLGSGVDNIDLAAAERRGIVVRNTPYGPTRAVAELTLGLALALLRHIPMADRNLRQGVWRKEIGQLLQGRILGVLGLGRIGREVAHLMLAMGCQVLGHDLVPDNEWATANKVRLVTFPELLADSEILCIHVSVPADIPSVIGEPELAAMRHGALLINMARGGVVDEHALHEALENGALAGAALDVFRQEPYTGPLTRLDNVILTPHLGSYARDAKLAMEIEAVNNLLQVLGNPKPA